MPTAIAVIETVAALNGKKLFWGELGEGEVLEGPESFQLMILWYPADSTGCVPSG